jgi:crotonobetainyl-CoA:carnitine CoA-transferase CaiB-like acyl-CoA transferase
MASSVPFGPINNIEQTFKHPQAVARGVVVEVQVKITARLLLHLLNSALSTRALERSSWWARR